MIRNTACISIQNLDTVSFAIHLLNINEIVRKTIVYSKETIVSTFLNRKSFKNNYIKLYRKQVELNNSY